MALLERFPAGSQVTDSNVMREYQQARSVSLSFLLTLFGECGWGFCCCVYVTCVLVCLCHFHRGHSYVNEWKQTGFFSYCRLETNQVIGHMLPIYGRGKYMRVATIDWCDRACLQLEDSVTISVDQVLQQLQRTDPNKAAGPDRTKPLKKYAEQQCCILCRFCF